MSISIPCPHCKNKPIARSSLLMSRTLGVIYYICSNPFCGHTYVANLEIVRTLSPSSMPDPAIQLPFSPRAWAHKREREAAIEQYRLPFEDE